MWIFESDLWIKRSNRNRTRIRRASPSGRRLIVSATPTIAVFNNQRRLARSWDGQSRAPILLGASSRILRIFRQSKRRKIERLKLRLRDVPGQPLTLILIL